MSWPIMLGGGLFCLWLIGQIAALYESQRNVADNADDNLLRMAYAILRLMETSPPGLINTALKTTLCQFLVEAFTRMDQRYGRGAGYHAAVETAQAQIKTLNQRAKDTKLPNFDSAERIQSGQIALPRFQQLVLQLQNLDFIAADEAKVYIAQLKHRHLQLESDAHVVRAKRAKSYKDSVGAHRYFQSAKSVLLRLPNSDDKSERIAHIEAISR